MRRPSPYETRARELALAAGLDLDSRVDRPGGIENGRGIFIITVRAGLNVSYIPLFAEPLISNL